MYNLGNQRGNAPDQPRYPSMQPLQNIARNPYCIPQGNPNPQYGYQPPPPAQPYYPHPQQMYPPNPSYQQYPPPPPPGGAGPRVFSATSQVMVPYPRAPTHEPPRPHAYGTYGQSGPTYGQSYYPDHPPQQFQHDYYNQRPAYPPQPYHDQHTRPISHSNNYSLSEQSSSTVGHAPQHATIMNYHPFNPQEDAQRLRSAMKGFGCDTGTLIKILCQRSESQRMAIATSFEQSFGRNLFNDVSGETTFNLRKLLRALLIPRTRYLAQEIHDAMKGLGTDEETLIEIICSSTNAEIASMKQHFLQLYGQEMITWIHDDTSGYFRRVLTALLAGARPEGRADPNRASADAQALKVAGVDRWGTDEEVFIRVFCNSSYDQLRATIQCYEAIVSKPIEQTIQSEMSGDLKRSFLAICAVAKDPTAFFAGRVNNAVKGLGTNDSQLIRIIVSRCEIDLARIAEVYPRIYRETLEDAIRGDTSGDYREGLLLLVRGNRQ